MKYAILSENIDSGFMDTIKSLELENDIKISAQYMADFAGYSVTRGEETLDELVTNTDDAERYNGEWGEYYRYLDEMLPPETDDDDEDW